MSIDSNGKIFFQIYSKEILDYKRARYLTNAINYNDWYTVVGTYDGNIIKLYLNGKLVVTNNVSGTIKPSSAPFHIASNPRSDGSPSVFSNFIYSDILLYDRVLSEEEITEVFSNTIDKNKVSQDKLLFYYDFK